MENFRKEKQFVLPKEEAIKIAKYSPDGVYLALLSEDKEIWIYECARNTFYPKIDCTKYTRIPDIEFSKNSKIIGIAADDEMILYGIPNGKSFRLMKPLENGDCFTRLYFGEKHVVIGVAIRKSQIFIYYDYTSVPPLKYNTFVIQDATISSLNFISHASIITSYSNGSCIHWDSTTYRNSHVKKIFPDYEAIGHLPRAKITHTDLSPDNQYLLVTHACSKISSYRIGTINAITFLRIYEGHEGDLEGVNEMKAKFMFRGENKFVICGSETFCIYIWDFETAECVRQLDCGENLPVSIIFNPVDNYNNFAVLQGNRELFIWARENLEQV